MVDGGRTVTRIRYCCSATSVTLHDARVEHSADRRSQNTVVTPSCESSTLWISALPIRESCLLPIFPLLIHKRVLFTSCIQTEAPRSFVTAGACGETRLRARGIVSSEAKDNTEGRIRKAAGARFLAWQGVSFLHVASNSITRTWSGFGLLSDEVAKLTKGSGID